MKKQICLNRSVLEFMSPCLTPKSLVLEFGGGWSSKWFVDRCGQLIVIETNSKWASKIRQEIGSRTRILVPRVGINFEPDVNRMLGTIGGAGLVLIDCYDPLRFAATKIAWPRLRSGGWLLLDDAQRPRYINAIKWMDRQIDLAYGRCIYLKWQTGDIESARKRLTIAWQKK